MSIYINHELVLCTINKELNFRNVWSILKKVKAYKQYEQLWKSKKQKSDIKTSRYILYPNDMQTGLFTDTEIPSPSTTKIVKLSLCNICLSVMRGHMREKSYTRIVLIHC